MLDLVDEAYKKWVSVRKCKDGRYTFTCKKGLWMVNAPKEQAEAEARYYFVQYFMDGEYRDVK